MSKFYSYQRETSKKCIDFPTEIIIYTYLILQIIYLFIQMYINNKFVRKCKYFPTEIIICVCIILQIMHLYIIISLYKYIK